MLTPANFAAALLLLVPYLAAGFLPGTVIGLAGRLPRRAEFVWPALLVIPYVLVTAAAGSFRWSWCALYLLLPPAVAVILGWARALDPASEKGTWLDFLVLALLGAAVDLRWFESAWPAHMSIFNKVLLLDAGIYGFLLVRRLGGVGFDLRLRLRDAGIGLREVIFYTPIALALGLSLGFLHAHARWPVPGALAAAWLFTFFFIAVPEELFFRGWLQNLLERRIGRIPALLVAASVFGLAHFNKHTVGHGGAFNWRYVTLAALAGIFYGRAWRSGRHVGASAVTHATVDTLWSMWLR